MSYFNYKTFESFINERKKPEGVKKNAKILKDLNASDKEEATKKQLAEKIKKKMNSDLAIAYKDILKKNGKMVKKNAKILEDENFQKNLLLDIRKALKEYNMSLNSEFLNMLYKKMQKRNEGNKGAKDLHEFVMSNVKDEVDIEKIKKQAGKITGKMVLDTYEDILKQQSVDPSSVAKRITKGEENPILKEYGLKTGSKVPMLKVGSKGKAVELAQELLGIGVVGVDGDFGGKTKQAVKDKQIEAGFTGGSVDGIVGKNTWKILSGLDLNVTKPETSKDIIGNGDIQSTEGEETRQADENIKIVTKKELISLLNGDVNEAEVREEGERNKKVKEVFFKIDSNTGTIYTLDSNKKETGEVFYFNKKKSGLGFDNNTENDRKNLYTKLKLKYDSKFYDEEEAGSDEGSGENVLKGDSEISIIWNDEDDQNIKVIDGYLEKSTAFKSLSGFNNGLVDALDYYNTPELNDVQGAFDNLNKIKDVKVRASDIKFAAQEQKGNLGIAFINNEDELGEDIKVLDLLKLAYDEDESGSIREELVQLEEDIPKDKLEEFKPAIDGILKVLGYTKEESK